MCGPRHRVIVIIDIRNNSNAGSRVASLKPLASLLGSNVICRVINDEHVDRLTVLEGGVDKVIVPKVRWVKLSDNKTLHCALLSFMMPIASVKRSSRLAADITW